MALIPLLDGYMGWPVTRCCPECSDSLPVLTDGRDDFIACPECATTWRIEWDAQVTGDPARWEDCSGFYPVPPPPR